MLAHLLNPEIQAETTDEDHPPERLHEMAQAHDDSRGKRQGDSQSGKQVGEDGHNPLEQRADDQACHAHHGDGIDQRRL
jgi:hypothetical protein